MPPILASALFTIGILGLFYLDRGHGAHVSKALWIPTVWLMIICSRPVSMWLGMAPTGGISDVYLEGSPIDRAVFLFLVAAALLVVIKRAGKVGPILRKNWPVVLFFAYAAMSILWSDYPFVTFKHWVKGVGDVMMVLIVVTEPNVAEAIERLITRIGFVLLPLSVLFVKYYPELGRLVTRSWTEEAVGVATQKNGLGELCAIVGLGLLWRFRTTYNDSEDFGRRRRLLALGVVFGMALWLLYVCDSLTSICALVMAGLVLLFSGRTAFRRRPALVHVVVVAMLAVSIYALFFQSSRALVQDLGRTPTVSGRTAIWAAVLSVPVSRWVGAGYETFWVGPRMREVAALCGADVNEAHDGYTEMLVNLGWIGVGLSGLLIVCGYRDVTRALRADAGLGSLRTAYLLNAVLTSFTEAAFRMMDPVWVFFLLAVLAVPVALPPDGGARRVGSGQLELDLRAEAGVEEEALVRC